MFTPNTTILLMIFKKNILAIIYFLIVCGGGDYSLIGHILTAVNLQSISPLFTWIGHMTFTLLHLSVFWCKYIP